MAKEWVLNSATNRFQLNFKRNVGATSEAIRKCAPKSLQEWKEYYFKNVRSEDHIVDLGKKLYVKISEVLVAEIDEITEEDCINYIKELVIDRTYDGYIREIKTIYEQLQEILKVKIEPAPDEWDRLFNVDFFIQINGKYIGLQIKPESKVHSIPEIYKERVIQHKSHIEFTKKYGGKVFYVFSCKQGDKKIIVNTEVIDEIKTEIEKLK
ncbi:MAG: MjaI family restriction endonuclease [Sphaerochaetaceae bacterium]|nr:MjaI family restriction endonuclease [Sphaerochaetaceae bacterium]